MDLAPQLGSWVNKAMANFFDDDPPTPAPTPATPPGKKNFFDDDAPVVPTPPVAAAPAAAPAPVVAAPAPAAPVVKAPVAVAPAKPLPWSIDWSKGGEITLPQSWQDFGDLMGEQASAGASLPMARMESQAKGQPLDLSTQLAQLDAARQRLGPTASGVADTLGYYASPTTWLNRIPVAGGGLGGALHEGLKSYFEGGDVPSSVLKGGVEGLVGTGAAHVLTNPKILSKVLEAGGMTAAGTIAHALFKDSPAATYLGGSLASKWVQPLVKRVEESGGVMSALRPYLAAVIQGPGSALQAAPGNPWSQWTGAP